MAHYESHTTAISFFVALCDMGHEVEVKLYMSGLITVFHIGPRKQVVCGGAWGYGDLYIDSGKLSSRDRIRIINEVGTLVDRMGIRPERTAEGIQIPELRSAL